MKKIIVLLLFISNYLLGQVKEKQSYPIYVNYPEYTVKVDVMSATINISVKENLTYYWYSSNKIMETKGGCDGRILNGSYTSYFLSGNLKEKGYFKNGLKNKNWIRWNENGRIAEINTWKNGVKNGVFKNFDVKGDLLLETEFKNGKLNGTETIYENGVLVSKRKFKKGIEIVQKTKTTVEKTTPDNSAKSSQNKLRSIFKKDKTEPGNKNEKDNNNSVPKKSFKEKFRYLFKKKVSSGKMLNENK